MFREIGAGFVCIGGGIAATLIATLAILPTDTAFAAAVFPPWRDSGRVFRAAASVTEVVNVGRALFILILRNYSADFATQLREAEALLILGSRSFVACSPQKKGQLR
jgi:hypothetical protein